MSKITLPYRQIHLDYHTSEHMLDVASRFDAHDFIETIKKAHVNSICCFARCHHGWLYYPSIKFPERIHPHLKNKNLLLEQVKACQDNDIRVPIYVTVQWDNYTADRHPEWLCRDEKGMIIEPMLVPGFYRYLCINTAYRSFLKEHVEEIIHMIPNIDGIFFDILWKKPCCCTVCCEKMTEQGLNWRLPDDRDTYAEMTLRDFILDMTAYVHSLAPDCSIYYNDGHVRANHNSHIEGYTHLEFDALPSGHGDYNNFPVITRANRNYGLDYAGHTGKFHTGWGDMHSYKNRVALEYECFMLLALGGKCIVGDQLHPLGMLDKAAYEIIGSVYSQVEKKEPWCVNAKPVTELAILHIEGTEALTGAHKILKEANYQYDIINGTADFSSYKVLILPDKVHVDSQLKKKLESYMDKGGSVLATFLSGTDKNSEEFLLSLGITMKENLTRDVDGKPVRGILHYRKDYADYIIPSGPLGKGLKEIEYVMYAKANEVAALPNSQVLLHVVKPPFYRNVAHYCSHVQTPSYGEIDTPAAVATDHSLYLAHNVFQMYNEYAALWCRQYVENAIDYLLESRLVEHNGPSTMEAILNEQEDEQRYVLHLLHYVPIKRAKLLEIIEDVYPLYDIHISLKLKKEIKGVYSQETGYAIDYMVNDGRINLKVPMLVGHDMIILDYV